MAIGRRQSVTESWMSHPDTGLYEPKGVRQIRHVGCMGAQPVSMALTRLAILTAATAAP